MNKGFERINVENIDIEEMVTKTKSMSPGSLCFIILQHGFSIIVSMWFSDYHGYQGQIVTDVGDAFKCSYEDLDGVLMYMNYKGWCLVFGMDTGNNASESAGRDKRRPDRKSFSRRHSPYARPGNVCCRSESLVERALGMYRQISKPLFGRSVLKSYADDAFSVPWRTVDRETAELREQLFEAQRIAAEIDEKRRADEVKMENQRKLADAQEKIKADAESQAKHEAESEIGAAPPIDNQDVEKHRSIIEESVQKQDAPNSADTLEPVDEASEKSLEDLAPSLAQTNDTPVQDASVVEQKPKYESIFQTARRLAEERVRGVAIPSTLQPNPYIVSSTANKHKSSDKGKELDIAGTVPKLAASVSAHEAIIKAAGAGLEIESSDDDQDFEPNTSEDDDEEEILQEHMEPIDEQEEVTTLADDVDSPAAFSEANESSARQDVEEDLSIEVSVVEESESNSDVAADSERVYVVEEAVVAEDDVAHNPETSLDAVQEPAAESDEDVGDEHDGDDSDQVTEEIAYMGSDNEFSNANDEHRDLVHNAGNVSSHPHPEQFSSPSRSWWPFSTSALFGDDNGPLPRPVERSAEDIDVDSENISVDLNRSAGQSPRSPKSMVAVGVQTPPSPASHRPFVPLSFIDISASGKRFSRIRSSRSHTSELPHALSQPLESSLPLQQHEHEQSVADKLKEMRNEAVSKPSITAQSLGLESKRGYKQMGAQKPRKRPMLYYGAGYGSRSVPYTINLSKSAPSGPMFAKQPEKTLQPAAESQKKGSITAQKILDIIGGVPPPVRSHSTADPQDVINPYELSSPYSVRMHPKTVQRRRVLVPLSARLAQASTPQASPAKKRADAVAASAKSLVHSIQSAAPPEIKASLKSVQKPAPAASPVAGGLVSKKVEPKEKPKTMKIPSLFASSPDTPAASKPSAVSSTPTPAAKPCLPKQAVDDTPKQTKKQAPCVVEPATPARAARAAALATSEAQLPVFAFSLSVIKPASTSIGAAKQNAISLSESQLPVFAFSVDTSTTPFLSGMPGRLQTQPLAPGEWKCDLCELRNPKTAVECNVCEAPRPVPKPTLKAAVSSKTATSSWADSGFKVPELKDGQWKCGVCDITNPKSVSQCRACESLKPSTVSAASVPAPAPVPVPNLWAESGFKMPSLNDDQWKCGVCDITNPNSVNQCRACESSRPAPKPSVDPTQAVTGSSTTAAPSAPNLWASSGFKMPSLKDGQWKCGVCDIANPESVSQCRACESPRPSANPASAAATSAPAPVANLWADSGFKMPGLKDSEWKCGVCDIANPKSVSQCRACESPKPSGNTTATAP
ncbi:E3 SUMO-protein ligase RanBP2, partial [Coemansia sp. RSA 486]